MQVQDLQGQIAALNAELGEGEELTPEALAALIAAKEAAEAALAAAMTAHEAALAVAVADAETAEAARAAAVADAGVSEEARAAAVAAAETAETVRAAAVMDAETAEAARAAAVADAGVSEEARAAAVAAAETAETVRAAAVMDAETAEAARAAAVADAGVSEEIRAAAVMDAETAEAARAAAVADAGVSEEARAAAVMEAETAEAARAAAVMDAETAEAARAAAVMDAETAEAARAAAVMDAETAEAARAAAVMDAETAEAARAAAVMDAETAEAARAAAVMDAETAEAARAAAVMDAETAEAARAAAVMDAETAEAARAAAVTDKETAEAALETAKEELATAKATLALVEEEAADALAKAAKDERIARADGVHAAIGGDPGGTVQMMPPVDGGSGVSMVSATRNAAGMVAVDVNGTADDDDYAGGETNAGSSAWNSVTMTKTNANDSTDMVVIYTDIEEPSDILFTVRYSQTERDNIFGTGTLAERLKLASSDSFPSGSSASLIYGEMGGLSKTFAGTFDGVPGNFVCTSVICSITNNAKGELSLVGENNMWRFGPTAPNDATVKEPDAAYGYFGWWLNKPEEADSPHMVEVFAGGVGAPATIDNDIVGTVRYSGPAAGKYATKTFTAGVQMDAAVGHFTATTNLTAKFGAAGTAGEGISGLVSKFVLDDTNSVPWKVNLELATFDANGFNGTTEVNFGGGATDNDVDETHPGAWQGTFYGEGAEAADAPSTVVGTFGAAATDGSASVLGAFGATKQ